MSDLPRFQFVRLGDDPFGRDEPTIFYRDLRHPEHGELYVWRRLLTPTDPLTRGAAA